MWLFWMVMSAESGWLIYGACNGAPSRQGCRYPARVYRMLVDDQGSGYVCSGHAGLEVQTRGRESLIHLTKMASKEEIAIHTSAVLAALAMLAIIAISSAGSTGLDRCA
jgi:hypothetical protein